MPSSDLAFFEWIAARTKRSRGMPFSKIPQSQIDALVALVNSGHLYTTQNPPMVWVNPDSVRRKKIRKAANTRVVSETDLPDESDRLDDFPAVDLDPLTALITQEEDQGISRHDDGVLSRRPEYRPIVTLVGCCAWPPPGTEIREIRGERVMVLSQSRCPVCKAPSGKPDIKCLVCDHKSPKSVEKPAKKKRPAKFRPKGVPAA